MYSVALVLALGAGIGSLGIGAIGQAQCPQSVRRARDPGVDRHCSWHGRALPSQSFCP